MKEDKQQKYSVERHNGTKQNERKREGETEKIKMKEYVLHGRLTEYNYIPYFQHLSLCGTIT